MRLRRFGRVLLKITGSTLFFLFALEIGIRLLAPVQRFALTPNTWDPVLGIRQRANFRGFINCPEFSMELCTNSRGLRDREFSYAKPAGIRRLLCLGNSITCGYGVRTKETYAKRLEARLNGAGASPHWEVINAGVGHTAQCHQLPWLESEGFRYEPDLVLLCVCPNDFADNLYSGMCVIEDGRLVRRAAPNTAARRIGQILEHVPGYRTFLARSHLFNTIRHQFAMQDYRRAAVAFRAQGAQLGDGAELTLSLIEEMAASCRRRGTRLLVMVMSPFPENRQRLAMVAQLVAGLQEDGIPCLDLRPHFATLEWFGIRYYYAEDGHWNAVGHRLHAEAVLIWLRDYLR